MHDLASFTPVRLGLDRLSGAAFPLSYTLHCNLRYDLYSYDGSVMAHRGYRGRIIKVTPTEVRVELEAQQRSVGVPRDAIPPEHGGAPLPREPPRFGAAPSTPAHLGMATPSHPWVNPFIFYTLGFTHL